MSSPPRLPMLRSPREDLELILMISPWSTRESTLLLSSLRSAPNFDKVLGEWQSKAADLSAEINASQDEGRNYSSELFRLKAAQQEAVEQLDVVKRENKNLA